MDVPNSYKLSRILNELRGMQSLSFYDPQKHSFINFVQTVNDF